MRQAVKRGPLFGWPDPSRTSIVPSYPTTRSVGGAPGPACRSAATSASTAVRIIGERADRSMVGAASGIPAASRATDSHISRVFPAEQSATGWLLTGGLKVRILLAEFLVSSRSND